MSSQHANPALTVRPPADVKAAAHAALQTRNRELRAFIVACLAAVADKPDEVLSSLEPYWPPPTPRGRPRPNAQ